MPTPSPIVLSGAGVVSPLGGSLPETWAAVRAGKVGLGPYHAMEQAQAAQAAGLCGGEARSLDGVAPERRAAEGLRRAFAEAFAAAGLTPAGLRPLRVSVVLGTSLHGMPAVGAYLRDGDLAHLLHFTSAGVLKEALGDWPVHGERITTCSACSSGLGSLAHAKALLEADAADIVLCGGYDPVCEYAVAGFHSLRVVAMDTVRPFAARRQGMQVSEGYAVLVLERAGQAQARGAAPWARIAGLGESADAHHLTQPKLDGSGAAAAMRDAMAAAQVEPKDIGLAIAHATGTRDNDAAEGAAMGLALGECQARIPVAGLKSRLGHTLGAAGAIEALIGSCALRDQVLPTTASVEAGEECVAGVRVLTGDARAPEKPLQAVLSSSLGFGGANTSLVMTACRAQDARAPGGPHAPGMDRDVLITGIGSVLPGFAGPGAPDLLAGVPCAGKVAPESFEHLINARRTRRLSPYVRMCLASTAAALADAGVSPEDKSFGLRTCGLLGSTSGSGSYCIDYYRQIAQEGLLAANPMLFAEGVPNAAAAHLSMTFGLTGPCQTFIGTITAGLDALRLAALRIASGEWERAVVCVGEEHHPLTDEAWTAAGVLAPGTLSTEGAVTFVLESAASAKARGAAPKAQLTGGLGRSGCSPRPALFGVLTESAPACTLLCAPMGPLLAELEDALAKGTGHPAPSRTALGQAFSLGPAALLAAWVAHGGETCAAALATDPVGQATVVAVRRMPTV